MLMLVGCRQRHASTNPLIEGLRESSQLLAMANENACLNMKVEANRYYVSAKFDIWLPKALAVQKEADRLSVWLRKLERQAQNVEDTKAQWLEKVSDSIYQQLVQFRDTVLNTFDTSSLSGYSGFCRQVKKDGASRSRQFAQRFKLLPGDTVPISMSHYLLSFEEVTKPAEVFVILEAAVNRTAYDITEYCIAQTAIGCNNFSQVSVLAHASSSAVKAGQSLEITAGIGEFGLSRKPVIAINGVARNADQEGVAQYSFVATGKPGKYILPVVISFERPDGVRDSLTKMIEYAIVP